MIMRNWLESDLEVTHGNLVEWRILTRADPKDPGKPGAILNHLVSFARATIDAECYTSAASHDNLEEIFYVVRGAGSINVGSEQRSVRDGDVILVPPRRSHILVNEEKEPMELLVVLGEIPPEKRKTEANKLVVRNWRQSPIEKGHWNHLVRGLLKSADSLCGISAIIVEIEGMKACEPHSHAPGGDELWYALEGEALHCVGQEVRRQLPGYIVPAYPSEYTHAQITPTDKPVKFFYVSLY